MCWWWRVWYSVRVRAIHLDIGIRTAETAEAEVAAELWR